MIESMTLTGTMTLHYVALRKFFAHWRKQNLRWKKRHRLLLRQVKVGTLLTASGFTIVAAGEPSKLTPR